MRGMQKSLIIGLLGALDLDGARCRGGRVRRLLRRRAQRRAPDDRRSAPGAACVSHHRDSLAGVPRRDVAASSCVLLAGFQWMVTARIVRGMTLSLKEREFVHAARFMGVPGWTHHLPPHPAEHVVASHHRRHRQRQLTDPRRGRAVVLRLRRAAAGRIARHADRRLRRTRPSRIRGSSTFPPASSSCWCWRSTWWVTACAMRSIRTHERPGAA